MIDHGLEYLLFAAALLTIAAVFAGSLTSRFGLPALLGFLALGMAAGSDGLGIPFNDFHLAKAIGVTALVLIIFSGGMETPWREVRPVLWPAIALATGGVAVSAGLVAGAAWALFHVSPLEAFLLGAIVSATDAAAVFGVLRSSGLNLRDDVRNLIEIESGSNDPIAFFLVSAAIVVIAQPATPLLPFAPAFAIEAVVGLAVGVGCALAFTVAAKRARLAAVELYGVLATATALMAYSLASLLHGNGFFAAYAAGIVAATRRFPYEEPISHFQGWLGWLAQVVVFVTLGLLVNPRELAGVATEGLALGAVLLLVARPASVFLTLLPFRSFDWRAKLFISWAGLRGAAPIVLATLPMIAHTPGARTVFNIVFFVVLLSNAVQGPTMGWLARRLGVEQRGGQPDQPLPPTAPAVGAGAVENR